MQSFSHAKRRHRKIDCIPFVKKEAQQLPLFIYTNK